MGFLRDFGWRSDGSPDVIRGAVMALTPFRDADLERTRARADAGSYISF